MLRRTAGMLCAVVLVAGPGVLALGPARAAQPLGRIDHVIVIYQENWSFDGLYERMSISLRTAWEHRANAKQKLGLKTTEEFAQWAARQIETRGDIK